MNPPAVQVLAEQPRDAQPLNVQAPNVQLPDRPADVQGSSWQASLALTLQPRNGVCRLVRNAHEGPLYVQKPFYPEGADLAHVYLLHPPGGLVSGDLLRIQVRLEEGARALLTTPGAGRVYRARADRRLQQQLITLDVSDGGSIEWLPQETIVYPDACGALDLQVDLGAASKFIGWEISCLGLPASGQDFDRGSIRQRICIQRRDRPLLVENFTLDDTCRTVYAAAAGLQSCPVNAVFIAGEIPQQQTLDTPDETFLQALESKLQALVSARLPRGLAGVSLVNGFVVARYLGTCSEEAKQLFIQLWKLVRPLLIERPALLPRIWAT